jgi:alcohol dehydrogenase
MPTTQPAGGRQAPELPATMRAAVFRGPGRIELGDVPVPGCGPTDAIVKVTLTTICGTDVHSRRQESPSRPAGSSATSRSG